MDLVGLHAAIIDQGMLFGFPFWGVVWAVFDKKTELDNHGRKIPRSSFHTMCLSIQFARQGLASYFY